MSHGGRKVNGKTEVVKQKDQIEDMMKTLIRKSRREYLDKERR